MRNKANQKGKKVTELEGEGPFVVVEKNYFEELKEALKAVIEGERELEKGETREFQDFIEEEDEKDN